MTISILYPRREIKKMGDKCEWSQDDDGVWNTSCENMFEILEGTPDENMMLYCPYCWKRLIQLHYPGDENGN